jgi:hypothetical protein
MSEKIININGILYVSRVNENGIYMVRVNADGTEWVSPPALTAEEARSGISVGPAPTTILVAPAAPVVRVPWWKRLFGF